MADHPLTLGFDEGEEEIAVCVRQSGRVVWERVWKETYPQALAEALSDLAEAVSQPLEGARAGVENPHSLLVGLLLDRGVCVVPVNPKKVDRARDLSRADRSKADPKDAAVIAELLDLHGEKFRPLYPSSALGRAIAALVDAGQRTHKRIRSATNQLRVALKQTFPEALLLFGKLHGRVCLRFVQRFATLADVKALSADQLDQVLRECGLARGDLRHKFLETVMRLEPVCVTDPVILQARHVEVCDLAAVILQGLEQVQKGEERLEQLLATHPDADLWAAVPGGLDLHSRLLRHFGDHRDRFIDFRHAQQYAGTCPVTIQSGKSKRIVLRRACSRAFRQTVVQLARHSVSQAGKCLWARQAFAKYRRKGFSAHDSYRRVGNHWIRILFTCWKNHTPYNERRHLADITAHQLRHDLGRKQHKPKEACPA